MLSSHANAGGFTSRRGWKGAGGERSRESVVRIVARKADSLYTTALRAPSSVPTYSPTS